ncbi:hypothetical protein H0H93_006647 [Arthromyces matolae]|nr:hypothetical protein H0H93_006647 [Arthromyces matolae]
MTRITNFGRKRSYLEATAQVQDDKAPKLTELEGDSIVPDGEDADVAPPPRKKRKRTKPSMRDGNTGVKAAEAAVEKERKRLEAEARATEGTLSKSAKKKLREKAIKEKKTLSPVEIREKRRLQRIEEKKQATTCYACRQNGHSAKDCPNTDRPGEDQKQTQLVGICYRFASPPPEMNENLKVTDRCGSSNHSLSRCRKAVDEADPLPFASCFVCKGKGHLASSCPQNKEKGVYPNGGCCKLCGEKSHLARDCPLRKKDTVNTTEILGTGVAAGADEDDFHSFKRNNTEIKQSEKSDEKDQRMRSNQLTMEQRAHKVRPSLPAKKVVTF